MTPPDTFERPARDAAAERLRQHLEEIARERDRAHRALQEREAELARIQRIARVGGVEVDFRDGFKNRRSPEYLIIHGLPPEAANETHEDWVERIHPDDRERTVKHFFEALAGTRRGLYRRTTASSGRATARRAGSDVVAKIERDGNGRALRLVGAAYRRHRPDAGAGNAARERGALPPDRRQRAGADLGHQARPHALLRQPGLCRFPRAAVRGSHRVRLAQGAASGRPAARPAGSRSPAKPRSSRSCWRRATATPTANGAGCARNRSRAGTRPASTSASSASPTTSPPPSRPRSICAG